MAIMRRMLVIGALGAALGASAQPVLNLSGYGTLGVVRSSNEGADYEVDVFRPNGPGRTHEWTPDVDSRFAVQASMAFSPKWSAVVQLLAQQRHDDSYQPGLEWANVKYQPTDNFHVRVGRVVLPIFMVTDTRRVGFANVWVRPPVEVYSLVPITTSDGIDASYRTNFGGIRHTLDASFGVAKPKFATDGGGEGTAKGDALLVVVSTLERGPAIVKLSYGRASLTVDSFDPIFAGFRQFGPLGAAIAERYELRDRKVDFFGVGATYDPGRWFTMAEWAQFNTDSLLGSRSAWYVSGGYRFAKKATLYATYASTRAESPTSDAGLPAAALPPPVRPTALALNAALNNLLGNTPQQDTLSLGMRWDVLTNAAVKVQLDEVRPRNGSAGTFGNEAPGYNPSTRTRLFSVSVDFVF